MRSSNEAVMAQSLYQSPIHILPCEILISIILTACLESATPAERFQLPYRVARVSKLWNAIVTNTPSLSSFLYIRDRATLGQLLGHLKRASGVALDVTVDNRPCTGLNPQMELVASFSGRLRSLEVHSWGSECVRSTLPPLLPRLEELAIRCEEADLANGLMFSLSSDMPVLCKATLASLPIVWSTCSLARCELQDLELTRCGISLGDIPHFLDLLEASKTLRRLVLEETWTNLWEIGDGTRYVTLPYLKELVYKGIPSSRVLAWIRAPVLEKLLVGRPTWAEGQIWDPVDLSFHSVQHLELHHISTSSAALINLLYSTPNVRRITIISFNLGRSMLFPDIVLQRRVWTKLEDLTIHGVFSLVQLNKVVLMHSSTIQRVNIHFLDRGLGMDASRHDFEEAAEAFDWLKRHTSLSIDRTTTTHGTRFRTWDDMARGRLIKQHDPDDC